MVFAATHNAKSAINLLAQHNTRQLVRKSHRRHRKQKISAALNALSKPERAADYKSNLTCLIGKNIFKMFRKLSGRKPIPLNAQGNYIGFARNF